jgi:hypothetical protein
MKFTAKMFESLARTATDPKAAQKVAAILNGKVDPATIPEVDYWIRQHHYRPQENVLRLHAVNALLDCYGVEPLRVEGEWVDCYHGDIVAAYINTGDPYTETVLLDLETQEFHLTSYGDWLEAWEARKREVATP